MPSLQPAESALDKPLQYLKGVGPKRAAQLENLGLSRLGDLLWHYPRLWQDRRETKELGLPTAAGVTVVRGQVLRCSQIPAGPRLALFKATIAAPVAAGDGRRLEAVWFKHRSRRFDVFATLKRELSPGADVWLIGRAEPGLAGVRELQVDEHYLLQDERWPIHVARIVPIYPLTEGLSQRFLRELVHHALQDAAGEVEERLPPALVSKRALLAPAQALRGIHFPGSWSELEAARSRLAYEELLLLELAWIVKRRQTRELVKHFQYEVKRELLTPFREQLGFELTGAQKRVINEIFADMQKPYPMTRLLQGDVGSGKTVVALASLLLAVENGYQAVLMAPTEILAEQHAATIARFLKGLPVRCATMSSRLSKKERDAAIGAIRRGELDIVVGTHALLEEDVSFPRLKLAVIDEQHRFGVRQRATLRQKSSLLDLLIMTATPIPRTLALALYGDLEVSTIDEMPPGKTPITTLAAAEREAFDAIRVEVKAARQAYVVYPIIEESSRLDLQSAKAEHLRLRETVFRDLRVALIHGQLTGKAKTKIMREFAAGEFDVLVATQVIEVGIDVPNATVMVIQNADRFGLSSLHQLRGRIGRGAAASRCYLVCDAKTPEARTRIETLVSSQDGFRIAEEDLKLRGAGELMGTAQHGELALKVADLFKDAALLSQAREDAEQLIAQDPKLLQSEHGGLRDKLIEEYQKKWNWIDLA